MGSYPPVREKRAFVTAAHCGLVKNHSTGAVTNKDLEEGKAGNAIVFAGMYVQEVSQPLVSALPHRCHEVPPGVHQLHEQQDFHKYVVSH